MTLELLVFALGGLLLVTGILGGGFEVRELKIPRVGRTARVLATTSGLMLILMGFGMVAQPSSPDGAGPGNPPPADSAVTFTIYDQLGDHQLSEQVTILLDGKIIGNLTVNEDFLYSEMSVTVPAPGPYTYTVEATARFLDATTGEEFYYTGAGQGTIQVDHGKSFTIAGSVSGSTWLVTLVDMS